MYGPMCPRTAKSISRAAAPATSDQRRVPMIKMVRVYAKYTIGALSAALFTNSAA
ncbi:hypothetical protein GCM10023196_092690 [Actinoallomurus vinaceus]|uniref:Uncharacterized protein n=1 Tax=Actinoallomurus vinaceus TaxID=1080074 RepID=A0ABP8URQ7_9ACTN